MKIIFFTQRNVWPEPLHYPGRYCVSPITDASLITFKVGYMKHVVANVAEVHSRIGRVIKYLACELIFSSEVHFRTDMGDLEALMNIVCLPKLFFKQI